MKCVGEVVFDSDGAVRIQHHHPVKTDEFGRYSNGDRRSSLSFTKATPKYGLIFHAQLVGQASLKSNGKMSRSLAAKALLATRVDPFGEEATIEMGLAHKVNLKARLSLLEEANLRKLSGTEKAKAKFEKYQAKSEVRRQHSLGYEMKHSEAVTPVKEEQPVESEVSEVSESKPNKKKKKKPFF